MPEVWCIAPGQQLAAWGWDDEFVLYNNLSGDTHLLDGDAYAVLECLQHAPATIDALIAVFCEGMDPDDLDALPGTLGATLTSLRKLSLIESRTAALAGPC